MRLLHRHSLYHWLWCHLMTFYPQRRPYSLFENNTGHTDGRTKLERHWHFWTLFFKNCANCNFFFNNFIVSFREFSVLVKNFSFKKFSFTGHNGLLGTLGSLPICYNLSLIDWYFGFVWRNDLYANNLAIRFINYSHMFVYYRTLVVLLIFV